MKKTKILIITILFFVLGGLMTYSTLWYPINENIDIGIEKIQNCEHILIEENYTCETNYFNYTTNPNYAWCNEYNAGNDTYGSIFEHSFTHGDIPSKTIWWSLFDEEVCSDAKKANIYLNKSGIIYQWECDYTGWECSIDKINKRLECDSLSHDGNGNGICDSGEDMCYQINVTKEGLTKFKRDIYSDKLKEEYEIQCEIK